MRVERQFSALKNAKRPICLAAGFFDGLHTGHQEVLAAAVRSARGMGGEAWAMTFDPHPLKILMPDEAPRMLTSAPHKIALLHSFGMNGCLLIPFTRRFASISASAFLRQLKKNMPTLRHIFVGTDWRYGCRGTGDVAQLTRWAEALGIAVTPVSPVLHGGRPVSSTRVRDAVASGDLSLARRLLGRPFSVLGTVQHGARIGRRLGYPTANIEPENEAVPPPGIYAARALVAGRMVDGAAYFGVRPTIRALRRPILEFHAFGAVPRLYGRRIEVFFEKRLRPDRRFPDTAALASQIGKDVAQARRILADSRRTRDWLRFLDVWRPSAKRGPR